MRFISILTSRGFAIFLLVTSVVLLILWNEYPNLYSPTFLIIPAFLFFSISLCIVKRIIACRLKKDERFLGSLIFHIGILIIVVATAAGSLTRFSAIVRLPQGIPVSIDNNDFSIIHNEPLGFKEKPFINIKLEDFETTYADERFPVEHTATVSIGILGSQGYRSFKEKIEVNRPFIYDGYSFLFESGGYAPRFILRDEDGNTVFNRFIRHSNDIKNEDVFYMEEAGLTLYLRFFPDVFREGTKYGNRSPVPKNPAFGIKILRRDDPFKDVWKGVLKKGEMARFGGMTLEFSDIRPYVMIQVVRDPSYWGIFVGWVFIVGGLLIRYLPVWKTEVWVRKRVTDNIQSL